MSHWQEGQCCWQPPRPPPLGWGQGESLSRPPRDTSALQNKVLSHACVCDGGGGGWVNDEWSCKWKFMNTLKVSMSLSYPIYSKCFNTKFVSRIMLTAWPLDLSRPKDAKGIQAGLHCLQGFQHSPWGQSWLPNHTVYMPQLTPITTLTTTHSCHMFFCPKIVCICMFIFMWNIPFELMENKFLLDPTSCPNVIFYFCRQFGDIRINPRCGSPLSPLPWWWHLHHVSGNGSSRGVT